MDRVVVVVNKSWEADPLVEVLLRDGNRRGEQVLSRPSDPNTAGGPLGELEVVRHPVLVQPAASEKAQPRIRWNIGSAMVEIWCIQDLMGEVTGEDLSSSERKVEPVTRIVGADPCLLVIAVGTAAHPGGALAHGSVVLARKIFVHDAHPNGENPKSKWNAPLTDVIVEPPPIQESVLKSAHQSVVGEVERRFLRSPLRPADTPLFVASDGFVSVGTVNVTKYQEYAWADLASLASFRRVQRERSRTEQVGSVETTHAIVGFEADRARVPFLWLSGIANDAGHFAVQVGQRAHAQNFVPAHNAGLTVAWLVPELVNRLKGHATLHRAARDGCQSECGRPDPGSPDRGSPDRE